MKRILFTSAIILFAPFLVFAQQKYSPLVIIPGITDGGGKSFGEYVNFLYAAAIGIAAFLAVTKIIIAGVKYMTTDVINTKSNAKGDIQGALLGLLLILGAYMILNIINPRLVNPSVNFQQIPTPPKAAAPPASVTTTGGAAATTPAAGQTGPAVNPTACGVVTTNNTNNTYTTANMGGCSAADKSKLLTTLTNDCRTSGGKLSSSGSSAICTVPKSSPATPTTPTSVVASGIVPGSTDSPTCNPAISQKTSGIYTIFSQNLNGCSSTNAPIYHQTFVDDCKSKGTNATGNYTQSSCSVETSKL